MFRLLMILFVMKLYARADIYIILLWSECSISLPVRYSYLLNLPYDNANVLYYFSVNFWFLLIKFLFIFCSFSSLIFSSIIMIKFYILSKIFFFKREGSSDARVLSVTKNKYGFEVQFLQRFIKSWKSIFDK